MMSRPLGVATNNVAEYQAVIDGLEAASDFDPDELVVRADSQLRPPSSPAGIESKHPAWCRCTAGPGIALRVPVGAVGARPPGEQHSPTPWPMPPSTGCETAQKCSSGISVWRCSCSVVYRGPKVDLRFLALGAALPT